MYIHKTSAFTFHFNQQTTFSQFMVTDHIQACHIGPRSALGIICLNLNLFRFFGIFLGHHFPNIFLFARKRFNKLFSQCLQYVAYFYLAENGQIKNLLFFYMANLGTFSTFYMPLIYNPFCFGGAVAVNQIASVTR